MDIFRSMLIIFLSFYAIGNVKGENNTKSILEFKSYQYPTLEGITFPKTIGVDGNHRYLKKYESFPIYNAKKNYIQGVGLFKEGISKEDRLIYERQRDNLVKLSKNVYDGMSRSRQLSVYSVTNEFKQTATIAIENAMRVDESAKNLNAWHNNEARDMLYSPNISLEKGIMIDADVQVLQGKVNIILNVENPSNEDVVILGFDELAKENSTRRNQTIQLIMVNNQSSRVNLFLDNKFLLGEHEGLIHFKGKTKTKLIFQYEFDQFYKSMLESNDRNQVESLLFKETDLTFYFKISNEIIAPAEISHQFEYITLRKSVDLTVLNDLLNK